MIDFFIGVLATHVAWLLTMVAYALIASSRKYKGLTYAEDREVSERLDRLAQIEEIPETQRSRES